MKTVFTFLSKVALLLLLMNTAVAQTNIFPSTGAAGIGTIKPNTSSLLDITSTRKGMLVPRMTKIQRDAIVTPATGLLIYQTNSTPGFYYYSGKAWAAVSAKGANTALSNLTTPTAVNQSLLPGKNNTLDLGSSASAWRNGHFAGNVGIGISTPAYKLDVSGDINQSAGSVLRIGGALAFKCDNSSDNIWAGGGGASNSTGYYNTAFGIQAMSFNTTGIKNTAVGLQALVTNSTGNANTATGYSALGNNIGNNNTGDGFYTLFHTTNSDFNTALGYTAGAGYDNGYNNVFLGANTDVNGAGYYNVIAIGQGTICTAPSQVTMGNSATSSYRAYADWSNISDGRYKQNVKEDVPGLKFINKLRPVTYNLNAEALDNFLHKDASSQDKIGSGAKAGQDKALKEKQQIRYTGFVAQEVEKAANDLGYDFSGVDKAKNENDVYGLRYAEFVVPLVKAVQELSAANDAKDSKIDAQQRQIDELKAMVQTLLQNFNNCNPCAANTSLQQSSNIVSPGGAALTQNVPNPFNHTSTINYTLPQQYSSAKMLVTDKSGKALREINLSNGGKGSLIIDGSTLSQGAYQYSLYIDGKLIDTKQMVLAK